MASRRHLPAITGARGHCPTSTRTAWHKEFKRPDTPDTGGTLLLQIIDKVFAIVTAAPRADSERAPDKLGSNRLPPDSTVVQLAMPGIPLYAEDFKDMFRPSNADGDKGKTALFSWLVDAMPSTRSLRHEQTPRRVSLACKASVAGADAPVPPVSAALQRQLETTTPRSTSPTARRPTISRGSRSARTNSVGRRTNCGISRRRRPTRRWNTWTTIPASARSPRPSSSA